MIRLRKQKEMACRELVELVTDYLEDALSRADRRRFEAHLAGCSHCTLYLEQFRETIALTGTLREEDVSPAAREELLAHFAEWRNARASR